MTEQLRITVSVKPGLIGKMVDMSGIWTATEMTPTQLVEWSFFEHQGYSHSVFNTEAFKANSNGWKTNKANEFFLWSEVITVDIDSKELDDEQKSRSNLDYFLSIPFVRDHCFMITPSSGNTAVKPNWHLSFALDTKITNAQEYRQVALALQEQIDLPTDHQTAKAAQPTMGTLFKNEERHAAGYHWADVYVNDSALRVVTAEFDKYTPKVGGTLHQEKERIQAENYEESDQASYRVKKHLEQPLSVREEIVLECLGYVLSTFNKDTPYDKWVQTWMGAHFGAPTDAVRDLLVSHPSVTWSDGEAGRNKFMHIFAHHHHVEGGYTVASLFYLARLAGWLAQTGYEIPTAFAEKIAVDFIPDWLSEQADVLPRLLLQSQTGSGKTQTIIHLWRRLGEPKTVIFVPSIKLATELATTLDKSGLPAELYLDKQGEELRRARVLVTTLQTFATKVHRGTEMMDEYGLIYVEESDQLLTQFARGGGGMYGSHVRDHEARAGFEVLFDAMQHAPVVWLVDATMSQVSYNAAQAMSSQPVHYIFNEKVKAKAKVNFVADKGEAMQVVVKALAAGKTVVAPCDTRDMAIELTETLDQLGVLDGKRYICITKDSTHNEDAIRFISNVEEEAPTYDFVAYNSVMASGVSITSVKPDVIVQFCGYLSPRNNLQILNRYRQQNVVVVHYPPSENFYVKNAEQVEAEAKLRVDVEGLVMAVPVIERDDLTKLRNTLGALSVGDEQRQRRAPKEFYKALLRADGRKVVDVEAEPASDVLRYTLGGVRRAAKEQREYIRLHWNEDYVPVLTPDNPPEKGTDALTVALGLEKAKILDMLNGRVPEGVDPEYIYDVCHQFKGKEFFLAAFARQDRAITKAEAYLADSGKALLTVSNNATMLSALTAIRYLFTSLDEVIDTPTLENRAPAFLEQLATMKQQYDLLMQRGRDKYDYVIESEETEAGRAEAFAKKLFARIGLKQKVQKRERKGKGGKDGVVNYYALENLKAAEDLLTWRLRPEGETIQLNRVWTAPALPERASKNKAALELLNALPEEMRAEAMKVWSLEPETSLEQAVIAAEGWI